MPANPDVHRDRADVRTVTGRVSETPPQFSAPLDFTSPSGKSGEKCGLDILSTPDTLTVMTFRGARCGFGFIELVIVVVISGVIAAIANILGLE